MQVTVTIPDEVVLQAQARGLPIQAYVERLVEKASQIAEPSRCPSPRKKTVAEAVAHIRESRKGVTLGGLKIRDLINEGRKY